MFYMRNTAELNIICNHFIITFDKVRVFLLNYYSKIYMFQIRRKRS